MKNKNMYQKGISLIIVFFMMTIMMAVVLGISTILFNEFKLTADIANSVSAFSIANDGIEKALYYHNKQIPLGGSGSGLCNTCNTCPTSGSDPNTDCNNCTAVGNDCNPLTCSDCTIGWDSTDGDRKNMVSAIVKPDALNPAISNIDIFSTGVYQNITREVNMHTTASGDDSQGGNNNGEDDDDDESDDDSGDSRNGGGDFAN